MRIQVVQGKSKKQPWFVRLRADNGKILVHSENYVEKKDAMKCAKLIQKADYVTKIEQSDER